MNVIGTLVAMTALSVVAQADLVATSGDVALFVPTDVTLDATQSNVDIIAFQETQCSPLSNDVSTDYGVISAGTQVECHFLHMDPVTSALLQGRVRFDNQILGVISTSAELDESDVECARMGVTYPAEDTEPFRGLVGLPQADEYRFISATELAVRMEVPMNSYTDQIRVLTQCD